MAPPLLRALPATCVALALTAYAYDAPSTPSLQNEGLREDNGDTSHQRTHTSGNETSLRVRHLINGGGSDVFLLDIGSLRDGNPSGDSGDQDGAGGDVQPLPWFQGFVSSGSEAETAVAAVTVGHPIRRMLSYFREGDIDLEASVSWMEDEGETNIKRTSRSCVGFVGVEARARGGGGEGGVNGSSPGSWRGSRQRG